MTAFVQGGPPSQQNQPPGPSYMGGGPPQQGYGPPPSHGQHYGNMPPQHQPPSHGYGSGMSSGYGPPSSGMYQPPPQTQQPPPVQPPQPVDNDEVWVETKAGDGKSYYYHAKTRETTWTKPEGPNIKIMTQQQVIEFYKFTGSSYLHGACLGGSYGPASSSQTN